ncbi:hypothetical protein [uncultured Alsobacter sp.]|uniref:hypothetical protein n=1 Tax=uncultured Alsobacter sp. TaxID=1748258 RepID=UPI0025DF1880|nr:hypothetical protein [uncultured Alsobacter sp.]
MRRPVANPQDELDDIYADFEWAERRQLALKPAEGGGWHLVKNLCSVFHEQVLGSGDDPVEAIRVYRRMVGAR